MIKILTQSLVSEVSDVKGLFPKFEQANSF